MIVRASRTIRESLCREGFAAGTLALVSTDAQLRACVALQVESVLNRGAELVPTPDRYAKNLARAMDDAREVLVTVAHDGRTIGFLWLAFRALEGGPEPGLVAHVNSLVLTESVRGRGLGSQVMAALHASARAAELEAVSLNYLADNARVAPFYARLGYAIVGLDLSARTSRAQPRAPDLVAARLLEPETAGAVLAALEQASAPGQAFEALADDRRVGPIWVFHAEGRVAAAVELCVRANQAGQPIAVLERLFVDPELARPERTRAMLAHVEAVASEAGAEDIYLTLWTLGGDVERAVIEHGYEVGRYKALRRLR